MQCCFNCLRSAKIEFIKKFNNSHLSKKKIGSYISENIRNRFTQLYGNSQKLEAKYMVNKFGLFDLVFIDEDHSLDGVRKDTEFAKKFYVRTVLFSGMMLILNSNILMFVYFWKRKYPLQD